MLPPRLARSSIPERLLPSSAAGLAEFFERPTASERLSILKLFKQKPMKDNQDSSFLAAEAMPPLPETARPRTEAEQLLLRMRISQKCRYNASVRLRRSYRFRLFTSMMFAVGLMVIPLLQNSPIQLGFSASVMAMVQVLLAVGVLVFTVIAGKAGYEIRADRLNQEGDALKEVSRRLTRYISSNASIQLEDYHHEYARLTSGKESHSRSDYLMARVEMGFEFPMWLGKRALLRVLLSISAVSNYVIPLVLILMEVAFISDMLTLTTFYPGVLHLSAPAH